MSFHAIELTRSRGRRRVDGLETPRHRADAAAETRSRRWRGAPEILILTQARIQLEYLPGVRDRYPDPHRKPRSSWTAEDLVARDLHDPLCGRPPRGLDDDFYAAHLRVHVLPEARRAGLGTRLATDLLGRLREAGARGCHAAISAADVRARRFAEALGFRQLPAPGYFGLAFDEDDPGVAETKAETPGSAVRSSRRGVVSWVGGSGGLVAAAAALAYDETPAKMSLGAAAMASAAAARSLVT